jgi:uncharacterized protein
MTADYIHRIAGEVTASPAQVSAVLSLLDGGATIPFIARYRKEATGALDEVVVTSIRDRRQQLVELDKRRAVVLETIEKQGKLDPALKARIDKAETLAVLEDLYLPYRPKRRTRGSVAREKGLEPLAAEIFAQNPAFDPRAAAQAYVDPAKELATVDLVLAGARDIIAEQINETAVIRSAVRDFFMATGSFQARVIKGKEETGVKFRDYFEWKEQVSKAPSHRVLAARRGEKEQVLMLRIVVDDQEAVGLIARQVVKAAQTPCGREVTLAVEDCYKRLMAPSIENEVRLLTKEKADTDAIKTFQTNLRQLLMAPVLGPKVVLAVDPGQRTGCKLSVLDGQGKFLEYQAIYIGQGAARETEAAAMVRRFCRQYAVEVVAIGNGTASRETLAFIRGLGIADLRIVMVNESGASYYSASEVARREFPDLDLTVRGAISIGRRLQDPLAELVKLDPGNIGVGQYQHDVDQNLLKQSLDDVIISSVNNVGVDINTASRELLMYVSGLGPALAEAVVNYRQANGPFANRQQFLSISRFTAKAFEQSAGFLRIMGAENPLDSSAVHPESYDLVNRMVQESGSDLRELMRNDKLRSRINLNAYVNDKVGLPTLRDIMSELAKPGRDPRAKFEFVDFKDDVHTVEDLRPDMVLPGVVTNMADFGAFVDIGVHQDGLVHVSQIADRFVKHPSDVLKLHQKVTVKVKEVDLPRKRISLTMKF